MNDEHGFTIIEFLAIIAIIGILAVMAIPRLGTLGKGVAQTTARRLVADMRYARRLAIAGAKDHIVRFYPAGGPYDEYRFFRKEGAIETQVGESRQISGKVVCTGTEELTFYPLGHTSSSGMISLSAEGDQYDVNVIAATGRVY